MIVRSASWRQAPQQRQTAGCGVAAAAAAAAAPEVSCNSGRSSSAAAAAAVLASQKGGSTKGTVENPPAAETRPQPCTAEVPPAALLGA